MFKFKVLLVVCTYFLFGFALECGINVNGSEEQFKDLTSSCTIGNKSVVTKKPHTSSSEESDEDNDDVDRNSECFAEFDKFPLSN